MASKASCSSTRPLLELFQRTRRRPRCAKSNQFPRSKPSALLRNVSTATPQHSEMEVENEPRPRWSYTPPAMAAPVRSRLPRREEPWKVNDDPKKLDSFYLRFLGPEGDKLLTDETKWLAVTHKSFDHGRRGFNDRLSYLGKKACNYSICLGSRGSNWMPPPTGKRIVELQMTLALLGSATRDSFKVPEDPHGRRPFQHPATEGIEVLNGGARAHLLHHMQISALAQRSGLGDVVRWNPKNVSLLLWQYCKGLL
jgi:large subunit ribosomal protein L15